MFKKISGVLLGLIIGSLLLIPISGQQVTRAGSGGTSNGTIIDGVSAAIKATVFDLTDSNPLAVQLVDANGDAITAAQDWTASAAVGTTAPGLMFEAKDFTGSALPLTAATITGDAVRAAGSLYGIGYTMLVSANGALQYGTTTTPFVTSLLDPCSAINKVIVPINISSATTTVLVNGAGASQNVYVCAVNLGPTSATDNVALIEDDTAACVSPTAGMAGGVTAASGWNIAANGGFTFGNGLGTVAKTAGTNRYVCLITSSTAQLSGTFVYAIAP